MFRLATASAVYEYEAVRLGVGETLIPLGALRRRLNELPADKDKEIVCYCSVPDLISI